MAYEPIITNTALEAMKKHNVTKKEMLAAFYSGSIEPGGKRGITKKRTKFGKYDVGILIKKRANSQHLIVGCWKREVG